MEAHKQVLPMRQDDLHAHIFRPHQARFIRVGCQVYQMSNRAGHSRAMDATLGQHSSDDRILVSLRDIATSHHHIVQKETRIRAVLARVGNFPLNQGGVYPRWLDHRDESLAGEVVGEKIDGIRHDMGTSNCVAVVGTSFVNRWLASVFFNHSRELIRSVSRDSRVYLE